MNKWWQDPRLDDEGNYDYLVNELPQDKAHWSRWCSKCDSCGKYHRLNFVSEHYFYCYDGYDSMSYTECWKCVLKDKVYHIKRKIKKRITTIKYAFELYNISSKEKTFKHYYKFASQFVK